MRAASGTLVVLGTLLAGGAIAALSPQGIECGERRCPANEYCSPYDKQCKTCTSICDPANRNYQPVECASDCQEYLHDKRYVLLERYEALRGEIASLWILVAISLVAALLSLLLTAYFLLGKVACWKKMRAVARRAFAGSWRQKTASCNPEVAVVSGSSSSSSSSSNNNNNNNHKKKNSSSKGIVDRRRHAPEDAELGVSKLTVSAISGSAAPPRPMEIGIGIGMGAGTATPNTTTTTTTLSGRHPSEDTTLDYAYDNPAMTPSPEAAQPRAKRESSF